MKVLDFEASKAFSILYTVANELEYVTKPNDKSLHIYQDRDHSLGFVVRENSSGYLQVHTYYSPEYIESQAISSLRSYIDVVRFCQTLINFSDIAARRPNF